MEENSYAAHLEELRSRWPAIAELADHPLGDWFFNRRAERSFRRRYRDRSGGNIILLVFLMLTLSIFGVLLYILLNPSSRSSRRKLDLAQPCSYFLGRNQANLTELWLTGLTCRQIAAIEVALANSDAWQTTSHWIGFCVWMILGLLGNITFGIGFFESAGVMGGFVALSGFLFWIALFFLINNASGRATRALKGLMMDIEERRQGKLKQFFVGCRNLVIGCLTVMLIVGAIISVIQFKYAGLYLVFAIFVGGTIFIPYYVTKIQPAEFQKVFDKSCAKADTLFAEIIQSESEKDLALHRRPSL